MISLEDARYAASLLKRGQAVRVVASEPHEIPPNGKPGLYVGQGDIGELVRSVHGNRGDFALQVKWLGRSKVYRPDGRAVFELDLFPLEGPHDDPSQLRLFY